MVGLLLLVVCLAGCAIPVGQSSSGGKSLATQMAQLEVGVTTRQEVLSALGPPHYSFEEERALGYYARDEAINPLMGGLAVFGLLCCFAVSAPLDPYTYVQYMVLIQFDAQDRLMRLERVGVGDADIQNLNERLQKWARLSSDQ